MKTLDELLLELGCLNVKVWADGDNLRYQAPKGILTSDILAQIKTYKTEILAFLNQSTIESQSIIKPVDAIIKNDVPLSFTQQQFWLLHHLEESNYIYNMVRAFRLEGDLDIPSFEQAIQCLIARHSILRTGFKVVNGSPVQVITPHLTFDIPVIDLQNLSETERISQAQQLLLQERTRAFDLNQSPVWRVTLIRLHPQIHLLMFNLHHIICDDWSIQVFLRELSALYQEVLIGKTASLPELPIQYADFAHWQNQQIAFDKYHQQLNYWQQQLADVVPILELPYLSDRSNHNTKQAFQSGIVPLSVSAEVTNKLKQLSQQSGTTLFTTLLTAFAILLSRYTHQEDLVVGTVIANRTLAQTNPLIGAFVNTLGLRIQIPDNPTFRELLTEVQKVVLEAYAHSEVPFVKVIEALKIDRKSGNNPLLQVMFTLETIAQDKLQLPGVMTTVLELNKPTAGATFDLTLNLWETNSELQGKLEYNAYLFNEEIIQRISGHFQTLLARIVESPNQRIGNLSILNATEREQLLGKEIQEIESEFLCLHELFEAQVEKTPADVALKFEGQQLTYRELNQQANQLAHHLQTLGVKPETLVGICVERSLEMIVGILGILKAGGAYVPLDPNNPQERLNHILEDAQVQVLVTNSQLRNTLDQSNFVVYLDKEADKIAQYPGNNLVSGVQGNNLAYMIYTSGSTGKPKGVLITHHNVVRLFKATEDWYHFNETDVWTLFHSFAFDFSVWELWGGLLYGGCVVVVPSEVSRDSQAFYNLLVAEQVTVLNQTPSAFYQLIQVDEHSKTTEKLSLRVVIFGGEALSLPLLQPWFERHGDQLPQLVNMYGITETTVHVTIRRLTLADVKATSSLIGLPIPDLQIYLLDKYQQPVPIGVVGELYVGGGGVARGYWRRSELTKERFVPNPFSNQQQGRLYKTGDLARYLPTGELEYKGRIDHQVKIRGFRIELGEIKALLSGHQAVQECVVLAREDEPNNKRLVAYIVPDHIQASTILNLVSLREQAILSDAPLGTAKGDRSFNELANGKQCFPQKTGANSLGDRQSTWNSLETYIQDLRHYLQKKLPEYMIPSAFVVLEKFPLTSNGKVDSRALPIPENFKNGLESSFVAPSTPTQAILANLWAAILSIEKVGIYDNFFDLGGHSLLATSLLFRIRQAFAIDFPLRCLFETPTIAALSKLIESFKAHPTLSSNGIPSTMLAMSRLERSPSTPVPLSLSQQGLWSLHQSASTVATLNSSTLMRVKGSFLPEVVEQSFNEIVRRHENLRTVFTVINDQPMQIVLPHLHLPLIYENLQHLPPEARQSEAVRLGIKIRQQPFNLAVAPLIRTALFQLNPDEHWLVITMHHLITDGWSFSVLLQELNALMQAFANGRPSPLPALSCQYADFALWQQQVYNESAIAQQLSYWQRKLVDQELYPSPSLMLSSKQAGHRFIHLPESLVRSVEGLGRSQRVTSFVILLSAFKLVLAKWSQQNEILILATLGNRTGLDTERMIGCFINDVILRSLILPEQTGSTVIKQLQETVNEAIEHKEVQLHRVINQIQHLRPLNLLASITMTPSVQDQMPGWEAIASSQWGDIPMELYGKTPPLELYVELSKTIRIRAKYGTEKFTAETIDRLLNNYQEMLTKLVSHSEMTVSNLFKTIHSEYF
ncbi:non-ribosomal peptide synthetase [Nostoc sp. 'Lobaria pulmonaria (5183) cyanobiont']|uniref:non-ribosomal peptide synthetase n=1 Tax=Nostoc sp. 'Lobaria pulmonaria (5183) cyanobiont' TaxID=1618022 RepID=UPI000CF355C0|nr:non-ribosomal peptide synthetase [Nostoc sp. 'Lobaria pulmonaria (5183) cyanobiont']AVH71770.1 non-ribosomal peptide synthetase [Nostoc sp. 'Lobaria pulmonaria (5183) cyanobiont']